MEDSGGGGDDHLQFPIGMKVLAIDANVVCLKYLVHLLRKCQYNVTWTTEADEALKLLRDNEEAFDIVITDVVRHDMDGFKLLQIIGLEMDIPVVMVSANDNVDVVKRGVREGAQAYLLKPVRLEEVKNLWQHVLRKRVHQKKSEAMEEKEDQQKKRERGEEEEEDEGDKTLNSAKKKPRVTWSEELHLKFVDAFEQLREKERVPNNILKLMNTPGLTRENVASHLQKHRVWLRKKAMESGKNGNGALNHSNGNSSYETNPTKRSIIHSEMTQRDKTPNFAVRPQISMRQFHYPQPTGNYCPVPEFKWLNYIPVSNNNWRLKACDGSYSGFSSNSDFNYNGVLGPNNMNPTSSYLHGLGSNYLNATSQTSYGNCSAAIPQEAAPVAWSFPYNITAEQINEEKSQQWCEVQLDKTGSSSLTMDDDELGQIFKQLHDEGAVI